MLTSLISYPLNAVSALLRLPPTHSDNSLAFYSSLVTISKAYLIYWRLSASSVSSSSSNDTLTQWASRTVLLFIRGSSHIISQPWRVVSRLLPIIVCLVGGGRPSSLSKITHLPRVINAMRVCSGSISCNNSIATPIIRLIVLWLCGWNVCRTRSCSIWCSCCSKKMILLIVHSTPKYCQNSPEPECWCKRHNNPSSFCLSASQRQSL